MNLFNAMKFKKERFRCLFSSTRRAIDFHSWHECTSIEESSSSPWDKRMKIVWVMTCTVTCLDGFRGSEVLEDKFEENT